MFNFFESIKSMCISNMALQILSAPVHCSVRGQRHHAERALRLMRDGVASDGECDVTAHNAQDLTRGTLLPRSVCPDTLRDPLRSGTMDE